jgi:hypothetical protein
MNAPRSLGWAPSRFGSLSLLLWLATGCAGDPFMTGFSAVPEQSDEQQESGVEPPVTAPVPSAAPAPVGAGDSDAGAGAANAGGGGASGAGAPPIGMGGSVGAGEGGSPGAPPPVGMAGAGGVSSQVVLDVIDDVEAAFPHLPARAGRNGGWYMVHDETGGYATPASAVRLEPARGASQYAAGISGQGFWSWGVQLGVALHAPASGYDASRYTGVRFAARGQGTWSLQISDRSSVPQGGVCVEGSADPASGCFYTVGEAFTVGADWQVFSVRFDELRLLAVPNSSRRLDPSAIYDIVFNFQSDDGSPFELLVDDLAFTQTTTR